MNRKIIRKRKGSSLVLILIVMSVLMILGTSMLTLAVSSYKFRALEQNRKANLYSSEAGLDEAYENIGEFVEEAIKQGNKAVEEYDKNFENLIKVERYRLEHGYKHESAYIDENGLITASTVDEDRKRVFQYGYIVSSKVSMEISYKEDNIRRNIECYDKDAISSDSGYKIESGYTQFIKDYINNECITKIKNTTDSKLLIEAKVLEDNKTSYPIKISVNSKYTKNSIPREIEAIYEINMAEHNVKYSLPTEIVKIPKNPIWSKALIVDGNMKINNGKVNIVNGDIYVKGKDDNIKTSGVDLTNKDSKLYSNKNIVTNRNLVLSYSAGDTDENIAIEGNVFCRNVLINESADGANLRIKKSLYTLDDLEINASNSHVNIEDSYYGVSDGSEGERNNPDASSSIIFNTEDIGNRVDENNIKIDNRSTLTIGKNVYIAGTSYVNLSNNIKYQTGESISIVGNYRAYTEPLRSPVNSNLKEDRVIFEYLDPLTVVTKYIRANRDNNAPVEAVLENKMYLSVYLTKQGQTVYSSAVKFSIVYNNKESKKLNIGIKEENIYKEKSDTLKLDNIENIQNVTILLYDGSSSPKMIGKIENVPLSSNTELNAFDKNQYMKEYYNEFAENSKLNLGEGININENAEIINPGSIFKTEIRGNSISEGSWDISKSNEIKAKNIQLKNQLFYMGKIGDYADLDNSISIDSITGANIVGNDEFYEIYQQTQPVETIVKNVKFNKLVFKKELSNGELSLLDNDANTYLIKGKGMTEDEFKTIRDKNQNSEVVDISSDTSTNGIVIAKGNIIIAGQVNFTGTIICGGDLIFEGHGDKNITYDKAYLENYAVNSYQLFTSAFADVGLYARDKVDNYLFAKVYKDNNSAGSSGLNKQLVKRTKWKLIK